MNGSKKLVQKFMEDRGWGNQLPDHIAKSISIEAAELLEIFQWSNLSAPEIKNDSKKLAELKGELADVFIYSLQMAILTGLEPETIIAEKLTFAAKKYPIQLMRKRSAGESDAHERYLAIKKEYRSRKTDKK